jgi:micrococcal nuclease
MKQVFLIIFTLCTIACFGTFVKVARVIDGDTFETETGERVRLVGINAPEVSDIFGKESTHHLTELIEGKTVDLLPDHISNDRDVYKRLLRYVILNDIDINKQMILDGYAFAYLKYAFDKGAEYKEAQLTATKNNFGIWSDEKGKEKESKGGNLRKFLSIKAYLIGSLIIILIFIGGYYYYKK